MPQCLGCTVPPSSSPTGPESSRSDARAGLRARRRPDGPIQARVRQGGLLEGIVDLVIAESDPLIPGADWKAAVRERIPSARRALLRHPWARRALETRATPTPVVLANEDSMIGLFRDAGFSLDLTDPGVARDREPDVRVHAGAVRGLVIPLTSEPVAETRIALQYRYMLWKQARDTTA